VEPEFITVPRSNDLIQQLGAGALDMGQADAAQAIRAAEKGAAIKFVASGVDAALYKLMALKTITSAEQLKGKTLSVDGPTGQTKYMARALLRAKGLKDDEYDYIYTGSTTDRYAQLKSGAVAAAMLTIPIDFQAEDEGFTVIGEISEVLPNWSFNSVELNTNWGRDKEEAAVRFLRGMIRGADFLLDSGNRAESIRILAKTTEVSDKIAEKTYDLIIKTKAYIPKLEPREASINRIMEYMVDVGDFQTPPPASKFIDRSYWQKATQGR
jgi:NitT/TauT family transport system substrate-binding protein